jgi:DNA repair protein RecO (recombination protein O)
MKHTDQAIVLRRTNYSESSLILSLFCRKNGLRTFIFQGAKKKHGNILLPLSIIEFEYYSRSESDLAKISSISPELVFSDIPNHPFKSATVFFIAELLQKVLKHEQEAEEDFFLFLAAEIHELELAPFEPNYPLWFVVELTKWLGIEPRVVAADATYFDTKEGVLTTTPETNHSHILHGDHILRITQMYVFHKDKALAIGLNGKTRNQLLRILLGYYAEHTFGFTYPNSLEILEEVFID